MQKRKNTTTPRWYRFTGNRLPPTHEGNGLRNCDWATPQQFSDDERRLPDEQKAEP